MENPQVEKSSYEFERYGFEERFVSYYQQLYEVLRLRPASILEVGVGDGVFGNFVKQNSSTKYRSLDIAEDLSPDIVGSVTDIPLPSAAADIVCAFEVLEHLPFEKFEAAVAELSRVATRYVIISLPHFGPTLSFSLKVPFIPLIRVMLKIPFPKEHEFNGQHYWEIGKRTYSPKRIRDVLRKHGTIKRDFVPFGSPYHHFFVLKLE